MNKGEKIYKHLVDNAVLHFKESNPKFDPGGYMAETMVIFPMIITNLKQMSDKEFDEILNDK